MVGILEVYVNGGISTEISFLASLDRKWHEGVECNLENIFSPFQRHESFLDSVGRKLVSIYQSIFTHMHPIAALTVLEDSDCADHCVGRQ